MTTLEILFADAWFRLNNLGWLDIIDLMLVVALFQVTLTFLQNSRAAFLVRGALALALFLLMITILLPLRTFDWLIRGALLVMLVATPVVLQPELRRWLEHIGRSVGLNRAVRQTAVETIMPQLLRSISNMSENRIGALIVLEGRDSTQEFVDSGIPINGHITAELIQTIFQDKTPLHDGAIIVRGDQIVAASSVLPLTGKDLVSYRRLGTRHRAAVGMSEVSDALVLVVSEETGNISVAYRGELHQRLDSTAIRQHLLKFYTTEDKDDGKILLRNVLSGFGRFLRQNLKMPTPSQIGNSLLLLLLSMLLTLGVWAYVIEQTNPTERQFLPGIQLRLENIPEGLTLMSTPPATISVEVQTTADLRPSLRSESFQAVASLQGLGAGLHQVQIDIITSASPIEVISITPSVLNVELAATITRLLPITVQLSEQFNLPPAYQILGDPMAAPAEARITGPAPLVERVSQIQATLPVTTATSTIREVRPLRALDANGEEVSGVVIEPAQTQVTLNITRRQDSRDVGVRAVTEGAPPEGYWLSGLRTVPANVTLRGTPTDLANVGSFVDTMPIDISQAFGEIEMQIPLDLPANINAVNEQGRIIKSVAVYVQISARSGDLVVTRPVELIGIAEDAEMIVTPETVDLLLSGPLPTLREIEANPELVRVFTDASTVTSGRRLELALRFLAPEVVNVQLLPATVLVENPATNGEEE